MRIKGFGRVKKKEEGLGALETVEAASAEERGECLAALDR